MKTAKLPTFICGACRAPTRDLLEESEIAEEEEQLVSKPSVEDAKEEKPYRRLQTQLVGDSKIVD